jgi:hypothetical protein
MMCEGMLAACGELSRRHPCTSEPLHGSWVWLNDPPTLLQENCNIRPRGPSQYYRLQEV